MGPDAYRTAGIARALTALGHSVSDLGNVAPDANDIPERDGLVNLLATDAHNLGSRAPHLAEARDAAAVFVGEEEAQRLVEERPRAILDNRDPADVTPPTVVPMVPERSKKGFFSRLFGG